MARTVFSPSHSSLDAIFTSRTTYIIPAYQRPYSWQAIGKRDTNNQVNQMWDDLWTFFEENRSTDKEYFLGSMVIIEKRLRTYEVVDGQQRLTTIALLFAAMRCFLKTVTAPPELEDFLKRSDSRIEELLFNREGVGLMQSGKLKIERATGYDFDKVLGDAIECKPQTSAVDPKYSDIADRYFKNRDYIIEQLRRCFLTEGHFTTQDATLFDDFFSFLNARVSIVLITTTDFDTAYFIFETLNNRGLPLSGRDLLRNFVIKELSEAKQADPAAVWMGLENEHALTEDFMGRWVESTRAAQSRSSAFSGMVAICQTYSDLPGRPKIVGFCDDLRRDLVHYARIVEAEQRIASPAVRHKVRFIQAFNNERYSRNFMLALFRHYDYRGDANEDVLDALRVFQCWMLYVLLAPGVRFSNSNVYAAIVKIKEGKIDEAKVAIGLTDEEKARLIALVGGDLTDNQTAKLLVAGTIWHEEGMHEDVVTQRLDFDKATLEHILPQHPAKDTNWQRDFSEEFRKNYTYKLGNMTLLTMKMNSAARNFDFAAKKSLYAKTLLPMTRALAERDGITPEFIEARHQTLVDGILSELRLGKQ